MGKVYALSDIHGFKSIYDQVKAMLEPEDKVIFLGDAADRGPSGWEAIKAILDDDQFVYIMGNHDLFFVKGILGPFKSDNRSLHLWNGGEPTLSAYEDDETLSLDQKQEYINRLAAVPIYVEYTTKDGQHIYLSHSGEVSHLEQSLIDKEEFTWNRSHFYNDAEDGIDLIVHGHTPIPSLISKLNEYSIFAKDDMIDGSKEFVPGQPFYYANWTKCDIDCCTIISGSATLLDLDTLEAIPFFVKGWEQDFIWRD